MFLQLNHQNLFVYQQARLFSKACCVFAKRLPVDEKFNLTQQIRRAALSVQLNIAEGASRHSERERSRYYEIASGSDAALYAAEDLQYCVKEDLKDI